MRLTGLAAYDALTRERLDELAALARQDGLGLDGPTRTLVEAVLDMLQGLSSSEPPADAHAGEQRLRAAIQLSAACRLALEWRAPGYAHAGVLSVGDPGALVEDLEQLARAPVNYARWNWPAAVAIERELGELIGVRADHDALLTTSSGMAALAVALGTLRALGRLRRVLIAPTVYAEVRDALRSSGAAEVREAESCEAEAIAAEAVAWSADAVFADPLENGPEQRVLDVEELAGRLAGGSETVLMVDGTMLPAVRVFERLASIRGVPLIYYESWGKCRQLGLDLTLGGLVVVPRHHAGVAANTRLTLGAALDPFGCAVAQIAGGDEAEARLMRMERAAAILAGSLSQRMTSDWRVVHPSLATHPQAELAIRRGYIGACVTVVAKDRCPRRVLRFAARAVELARRDRIALVVGESFGFTAPRLTPTLSITGFGPFARLSAGVLDDGQALALADLLARAASLI